ncbi:hypothetical protein ACFL9T_07655 [Thermodesulfobacteriota bacterium]
MTDLCRPPEGSILEKIAWAEKTCDEHREGLLRDKVVAILLINFQRAADKSRETMLEVGVAQHCKSCEDREGGSCCGAGLEDKYSGTLLLINLLLNVAIPAERRDPRGCFFLGERGCLLRARHVICVNYLCKKITDHIPLEKISTLRDREGDELECLFLLNERIKAVIRERNSNSNA